MRTNCASRAWHWASPAFGCVLPPFVVVRVWLSLFAALVLRVLPPVQVPSDYLLGIVPVESGIRGLLLGPWQRWDALWYLRIASRGYDAADGSAAFFPLYPLLVRAVGLLAGRDFLLAALVVSNLACLAALVLLYKLTRRELDEGTAGRAVVYQMLFPTAFFLLAPYGESLFLLWTTACLYAARRGRWWLAGFLGFLAALTRPTGILLTVPLAWEMWRQSGSLRKMVPTRALALCLPPLGIASYSYYLAVRMHDPLLWLGSHAQSRWSRSFAWPWETVRQIPSHLLQPVNNVIDLMFLLLFVALTVWVFRKLPGMYGAYMAVSLLAPLFSPSARAPLYSMPRFVLILFPGFLILGQVGAKGRWNRLIVYGSLLLLTFFAALYVAWYWVA